MQPLTISSSLRTYASEKRRLQRLGQTVDDFDLLIGATALAHDMTMVTNNTKDFNQLQGIVLEDWTKPL